MYGIGALASQLLVSDSAVCDMRHSHLKALIIANEVLFGGTIVVAEYLFVYIAEQVKRLYRNVRALQSALEKAPKVFESVGVDLSLNIPFRVVNRFVRKVRIQTLIGHKRIGVDRAFGCDMSANLPLQVMLATRRNDVRRVGHFQSAACGCR